MNHLAKWTTQKIIVIACLLFAAQAGAADLRSELTNAPPERLMAFLNVPHSPPARLDPVLVARFKSLLDQLSANYPESERFIADWTSKIQDVLESDGIEETLLNMMEGINSLGRRSGCKSYKHTLSAYAVLRNKGMSRSAALKALPAYIQELLLNGTIKN